MHPILRKLEGGDRRSIGKSNEVVAEILADPVLFDVVFGGIFADDPILRMRAADAVEKVTAIHAGYLRPHKEKLVREAASIDQKEVRWHVALMLPRLELSHRELRHVLGILLGYLNDRSSIVKTFAMQALADIAKQNAELRPSILAHLRELAVIGTPAMKARGRKLLAEFERKKRNKRIE